MAQGLQVWDGNGNVAVDLSTRLSRILGSVIIDAAAQPSGTISDAGFATGIPFVIFTEILYENDVRFSSGITITTNSNSFSWQADTSAGSRYRATYGVY